MHQESMKLMRSFRANYAGRLSERIPSVPVATILDIGAKRVHRRHNTYRRIFASRKYAYTGMDLEPGLNVDVVGYENITQVYDIVISGQVLEHVKRPWEVMKKWAEYFKIYICVIAPHTCGEHKHPYDTYRYFPDGMQDLFDYAGIKTIEIVKGIRDTMGIGKK